VYYEVQGIAGMANCNAWVRNRVCAGARVKTKPSLLHTVGHCWSIGAFERVSNQAMATTDASDLRFKVVRDLADRNYAARDCPV